MVINNFIQPELNSGPLSENLVFTSSTNSQRSFIKKKGFACEHSKISPDLTSPPDVVSCSLYVLRFPVYGVVLAYVSPDGCIVVIGWRKNWPEF